MSSTAPEDKSPLERVTLFPAEMGHIRLELFVGGKVAYWEVFRDWATALDLLAQIVRDRAWEIVLGRDHGNGDR